MYRGKVVKYVAHSYTPEGEVNYSEMTIQQRAQHLLKIGVVAKTDFNSELLEFGYAAHVAGVGKMPVGLFETSGAAIKAGAEWLEEKALERGC